MGKNCYETFFLQGYKLTLLVIFLFIMQVCHFNFMTVLVKLARNIERYFCDFFFVFLL